MLAPGIFPLQHAPKSQTPASVRFAYGSGHVSVDVSAWDAPTQGTPEFQSLNVRTYRPTLMSYADHMRKRCASATIAIGFSKTTANVMSAIKQTIFMASFLMTGVQTNTRR